MTQSNATLNGKQESKRGATVHDFSSFDSPEAYGKIKQAEINFKNEATQELIKNGYIEPEGGFVDDGQIHNCAENTNPDNQDAHYALHKERPLTAEFWIKGEDRVHTFTAKPEKSMTNIEREILRARIQKAETQQKEEWVKEKQAKEETAQQVYASYPEASDDNPYFKQKGARSFGLVKVDPATGNIAVPMYSVEKNSIVNIQYLSLKLMDNKKTERLLYDGKIHEYFPLPATNGNENAPILIAEDFATGASLHEATGYETWITFSPYNLSYIAEHVADKYKDTGRAIVICADFDVPSEKMPEEGGIGVYLAREAAEAIGCCLAICPPLGDKGRGNFNKLHIVRGIDAVTTEIQKSLAAGCLQQADPLPPNFEIRYNKLFYEQSFEGGKTELVYLCRRIRVLGKSRTDDSEEWGLYIEWQDDDHGTHVWILQKSNLAAFDRAQKIIGHLMSEGLDVTGNRGHWDFIYKFLLEYKTKRRVTSVNSLGWHFDSYVMPDKVYGVPATEDIIVLDKKINKKLFQVVGSFEEWQQIPSFCVGNMKLTFALCCAFAAVLLHLANLESGIFSLEGESSSGKTTALKMAASIFGSFESHINQWRATDNALEGIAATFSDNLLLIDELGQGDPRAVAQVSYMITSGQGKARMTRNADLRKTHVWRSLGLSSGEIGLADKLLEKGDTVKAGQQVRFVGIPTTKQDIQNIHGMPNAAAMLKRICDIALKNYGHAGRIFIEYVAQPETLAQLKEMLPKMLDDYVTKICPEEADGQVKRVAQRFALVAIAGDLAIEYGILPVEIEPLNAVKTCFDSWLDARGSADSAERIDIQERIRLCIEQHALDRFQSLSPRIDMMEQEIIPNIKRWGFKNDNGIFYILPKSFKEIMQGYNPKQAAKILYETGWIFDAEQGRYTKRKTLPEIGQQQVYWVRMPEEPKDPERNW